MDISRSDRLVFYGYVADNTWHKCDKKGAELKDGYSMKPSTTDYIRRLKKNKYLKFKKVK